MVKNTGKNKMKRYQPFFAAIFCLALALCTITSAMATEPTPDDTCTTYPADAVMRSGGPELDGKTYLMSCRDSVWTAITANHDGTCAPDGIVVGGGCWYIGNIGQSCDDVCATRGGYNALTATYAGSSGTDSNCHNLLTPLAPGYPSMPPENFASDECGGFPVGCYAAYSGGSLVSAGRCHEPTTSSGAYPGIVRRICACGS